MLQFTTVVGDFFENTNQYLVKYPYIKTVILSLFLIFFFIVLRKFLYRSIDNKKINNQDKAFLKKKSSQYLTYTVFVCVFFIWFAQLQIFFVSMFAIAAAIVVAFKELIMCFTGGTLINISNIFKIGHRIEVDGVRGFVIEKNLLTTKVLEIGPEDNSQQTTGDVITIPNSQMLSKYIVNESYFKGYSIKSFIYKIDNESDVLRFENEILTISTSLCSKYLESARKNISSFCQKEGVHVPSVDPRTKIIVDAGKDFSVLVKLAVPTSEVANIEQELNRFFLNWKLKNKVS